VRGKYEADIAKLQAIIQHGIDSATPDSTWSVAFHKLTGNVPLGADSSQFATRKRFAMAQLMLGMLQSAGILIIGGLIALGFLWVGARGFPGNGLHLLLGAVFLALIYVAGWRPFFRRLALYRGIKPLVQTTPDSSHDLAFVAERAISRQFGKARLKSRMLGVLLMMVSGGFCYAGYSTLVSNPQDQTSILVFVMPLFFFVGLGVFITGMNRPELVHRHGHAQARWKDFPAEMKVCVALGLVASLLGFLWVKAWMVF